MIFSDLYHADCRDVFPSLDDNSIDAVITDPPYPFSKRDYGHWTFDEWVDVMVPVIRESKRVLKPSGSMMILLQPNSKHVGQLRPWLWDFLSWVSHEWNVIQDVYWWNICALPGVCGANRKYGLMRPSVKYCVWLGDPRCYRNQDEVLWTPAAKKAPKYSARAMRLEHRPSGHTMVGYRAHITPFERGGSIPFNLIPMPSVAAPGESGHWGHGAGTPYKLCEWWVRYITKPGDVVLDPFMGAGTIGMAAIALDRCYIGVDAILKYVNIADERICEVMYA